MAKNKVISICLLLILSVVPLYSVVANDGYCVRVTANSYVGVREKGGNNRGFTDRGLKNMMADVGWKPGYAWCAFFVRAILDECGIENKISGWSPTAYNKKDVIYTNGRFYQSFSSGDVLVMTLSYNKFRNTKRYKAIGHTGIVDAVGKYSVRTVEGNTNDAGSRDSRSGDGVYVKIRPLNKSIHITRWKKRKQDW
jgi:hypothetical protein